MPKEAVRHVEDEYGWECEICGKFYPDMYDAEACEAVHRREGIKWVLPREDCRLCVHCRDWKKSSWNPGSGYCDKHNIPVYSLERCVDYTHA